MKNIEIKISKETRMVYLDKNNIGVDGENLQGNLIISFEDKFVDGIARLEYKTGDTKAYFMLEKVNETYVTPIKSIITKYGQITMQLVIVEGTDTENVPIFKSNVFYMICNNSINADTEIPEDKVDFVEFASTKFNSIDEAIENLNNTIKNIEECELVDYAKIEYVDKQIENNIGKEIQLDFNAILEYNKIIATLDESIKDFELKNNTGYLFHIYLPLVTLTGDLDNDYEIYLKDKENNDININSIFQKDINKTSTVGDLCQIQDYDVGIGYSWEFYGHFRKITENSKNINVIYTDTVVRETNPSMTGEQLHKLVVNNKLKIGTTVMCLSDYENNGTKYYKGHTYLIENDSDTEDIMLIANDILEKTGLYIEEEEEIDV